MNVEWLRTRGVVAAAVGAGILLGAAGILLYQQIVAEKKRLDRVASSVSLLRREIDHLKSDTRPAGRYGTKGDSRSISDADMYSTVSRLDEDDEDSEFFDLSDEDVRDNEGDTGLRGSGDSVFLRDLLDQVDSLLTSGTSDEKTLAYHLLHEHQSKYPSNVDILWRLANASHSMGRIMSPDLRKEFLFEGLDHAKAALAIDDKNADAHKWFAITLGECGDFLSTKEKISNGYVFKQHVDRAISLKPSDHSLYHLLGRFQFEVASLSWLERKLAASLIAAPPEGSYEEACTHFLKCEELCPKEWKENRLFIAKCYVQLGQIPEALKWLDKATEIMCKTPEDHETEKEVKSLLLKYESYRS